MDIYISKKYKKSTFRARKPLAKQIAVIWLAETNYVLAHYN